MSVKLKGVFMDFKNTEYAYLSGIFDTRGFIKIDTPKYKDIPSLYAWVTSKSFSLMEFLQKYGAKVSRRSDGQYKAKWKEGSAYFLLKKVYPHLRVKKDQAEVGIEFYDEKKKNPDPKDILIPLMLRLRLMRRSDEED